MGRTLRVNLGRKLRETIAVRTEKKRTLRGRGAYCVNPRLEPQDLKFQFRAIQFLSHSACNELQAFALLWYLLRQILKALFKHKSVQPHNLSERSGKGIAA